MEQEFDLGRFFQRHLQRWRTYVAIAFVSALLAYGGTFLLPKWYRAEAILLPPEETEQLAMGLSVQRLMTRVPSLGSLSNNYTPGDVHHAILQSRTVVQSVVERFGLAKIYKQKSMEKTVREFRRHTRIELQPNGTLSVAVEDRSADRAAQMANALVGELDRFNVERRNFQAKRTRQFLEQRVEQTDSLSRASEALLRVYQEKHHVVAPVQSEDVTVAPLVDLMGRKTQLEIRLNVLRSYQSEQNESVVQARAELAAINRRIASLPQIENEMSRLVRDVRLYQQIYVLLTTQLEDARIRESMDTPTITVLDGAVAPERQARPIRRVWAGAAAILALFIAMLRTELGSQAAARRRSAD